MQGRIYRSIHKDMAMTEHVFRYLLWIRPGESHHMDMISAVAYTRGDYETSVAYAPNPSIALRSHECHDPCSDEAFAARDYARNLFASEHGRVSCSALPNTEERCGIVMSRIPGPVFFASLNPLVYDRTSVYVGARKLAYFNPKPDRPPTMRRESAAVVLCTCTTNYYHVTIEFFGKLFGFFGAKPWREDAEQQQGRALPAPIFGCTSSMDELFWEMAGIFFPEREEFRPTWLTMADVVQCDELYVMDCKEQEMLEPPRRNLWDTMSIPLPVLHDLREQVFRQTGIRPAAQPTRAIYISRSKGDRRVEGEEELIQALKAWSAEKAPELDWFVFDDSRRSFVEQVRVYSEAALVVGPHGAGLVNVMYTGGAKVLEFPTAGFHIRLFRWLTLAVGGKFAFATKLQGLYTAGYAADAEAISATVADVHRLWFDLPIDS